MQGIIEASRPCSCCFTRCVINVNPPKASYEFAESGERQEAQKLAAELADKVGASAVPAEGASMPAGGLLGGLLASIAVKLLTEHGDELLEHLLRIIKERLAPTEIDEGDA